MEYREDMLDAALLTAARTAPLEHVIGAFLSTSSTYLGALYSSIQLLELDYPAQPDNAPDIYRDMKHFAEYLLTLNKYILGHIVSQRLRDASDIAPNAS